MWPSLFFISIFPIVAALIARWWFGVRVLDEIGGRACRCDLGKWTPPPGDTAIVHRAEDTAAGFGNQLRTKALAEWKERDPKAAASRESSRRFGMAVPPLSAMVAVLAVVVAKIPVTGALTIVLAATALASVFGVLSMPAELAVITKAAKKIREGKSFPLRDDEEAVIRCAIAHSWKEALPPILGLLQR